MSSEKGLVIAPTEQLPFKCASSVLLFFSAEISFPLIRSFVPKGVVGGNFIRFFPLSSRRAEFSLSLSMSKSERVTESYGEMHTRDGDDVISLRSLRFLLLFVFFERERVKEKFESFFFSSPVGFRRSTETFVLFFGQTKQEKGKPLLTFFTYYGMYS